MLLKGEIKDPRLPGLLTVTDVGVSKDMRDAKVFVSTLGSQKEREKVLVTLNHAAGFIQSLLGRRITLRFTPKLTFYWDGSLEQGFQVGQKLKDLTF